VASPSSSDRKATSDQQATSSTRRAARLAQKGKGKRVRFQGGTLFPMIVAGVLIVGLALIVYARTSRPAADASAPRIYTGETGDHWHGAYGFQLCGDTPNIQLAGDLEARDSAGQVVSQAMRTTGIHSHDDGVIHWHAWTTRSSGSRARFGIFLDNYEVELSNDKLELPSGGDGDERLSALNFPDGPPENTEDFPLVYEEDETQCAGEDAELKVVVWTDYTDPDSDRTYTDDFDEIPFDRNGLVIVIAYVPPSVDVVMPVWAADLPTLGAIDGTSGQVGAPDSVPAGSDVTGSTDVLGSGGGTPDSTPADSTETDSTEPEATVTDTTDADSTDPDGTDEPDETTPETTESSGSDTTEG